MTGPDDSKKDQESAILKTLMSDGGWIDESALCGKLAGELAFSDSAKGRASQVRGALQRLHARTRPPVEIRMAEDGRDVWQWRARPDGHPAEAFVTEAPVKTDEEMSDGAIYTAVSARSSPGLHNAAVTMLGRVAAEAAGQLMAPELPGPDEDIDLEIRYRTPDGERHESLGQARAHMTDLSEFMEFLTGGGYPKETWRIYLPCLAEWERFRAAGSAV